MLQINDKENIWSKYLLLTLSKVDSTNNEAKRLITHGIYDNIIIWAHEQYAGRGTKGSKWYSPPGNLYCSVIFKNRFNEQNKYKTTSLLMGYILYNTILKLINDNNKKNNIIDDPEIKNNIKLKWPNDLLIYGNKLAGILVESINIGKNNFIIAGFGVNIKSSPQLNYGKYKTTSLNEYSIDTSSEQIIDILIKKFDFYHNWYLKDSTKSQDLINEWTKIAYKFGENIRYTENNKSELVREGKFIGINAENGAIKLKSESNDIIEIICNQLIS